MNIKNIMILSFFVLIIIVIVYKLYLKEHFYKYNTDYFTIINSEAARKTINSISTFDKYNKYDILLRNIKTNNKDKIQKIKNHYQKNVLISHQVKKIF